VLSSLEGVFQFLRFYRALPADHLRVFSSPSQEDLDGQLIRENNGLESNSVTAAQFLQERMLASQEMTAEVAASETQEQQKPASIGIITNGLLNEGSITAHAVDSRNLSSLERRRLELESGEGGDHDLPYTFALPHAWPQVRAWLLLLVKVRNRELQP
jgi:hypothetical protein